MNDSFHLCCVNSRQGTSLEGGAVRRLIADLRYARFRSSILRRALGLYFREGRVYRLSFGPLRGMRMVYDRSVNYHTILGLGEPEQFQVLSKISVPLQLFQDNSVVCDLGANIGTYALWFSRHLRGKGVVYAFEPAPSAVEKLSRNLSLNEAANVQLVEEACSDRTGEAELFLGVHPCCSSVNRDWVSQAGGIAERVVVRTTTLDNFFYGSKPREGPDFIKMDIEGGGAAALKGCDACVRQKRPLFLVESHTPEEDLATGALLMRHNYQAYRLNNAQWVKVFSQPYTHPMGVWGNMLLCPSEKQKRLYELLPP